MNEQRRLIVVDSSVLPEVILKVLAVKKLQAGRKKALPLHASASASPAAPTTSTGTVYSPTMTR